MPEMHFRIRWPDGVDETCYSPSLVIKDFFQPGETYALAISSRSRTALKIASDRVEAKYGFPARGRLDNSPASRPPARASPSPDANVSVESFHE